MSDLPKLSTTFATDSAEARSARGSGGWGVAAASGDADDGTDAHRVATNSATIGHVVTSRDVPLPPPTPEVEALLRQLLLAGYIENVGRRAPPERAAAACAAAHIPIGRYVPYEVASDALRSGVRAGAAAAAAAEVDGLMQGSGAAKAQNNSDQSDNRGDRNGGDFVWIHPASAVSEADAALAPPFIVFAAVRFGRGGRAWATGVTAVEESWIAPLAGGTPLLRRGSPLSTPPPVWDARSDTVIATFSPVFGDAGWRLCTLRAPLRDIESSGSGSGGGASGSSMADARRRAFARALLEGNAIPSSLAFVLRDTNALRGPPSDLHKIGGKGGGVRAALLLDAMSSPRAHLSTRAAEALGSLSDASVESRGALKNIWKFAPGFLIDELAAWCREDAAKLLRSAWPSAIANEVKNGLGGSAAASIIVVDSTSRVQK